MVALNVLRELDLLFTHAINELAARWGLATCAEDAPPGIKLKVLSAVCAISIGEQERYQANAGWRGRLERRAVSASAPPLSAIAVSARLSDKMMSTAITWYVSIAAKLVAHGRMDSASR